MRIAIVGPDGSGKTSVCNELIKFLKPGIIIHAVKDRNHLLKSTSVALSIWYMLKKFGYISSTVGRFFVFYPFEYFENLKRFLIKPVRVKYIIYDRHPIDRVIMKHEFLLNYKSGNRTQIKYLIEYPLLSFWSFVYRKLFASKQQLFVLLPEAELCFYRSGGQYKSLDSAQHKIEAYKMAIKEYKNKTNITQVYISQNDSIEDVANFILQKIKH